MPPVRGGDNPGQWRLGPPGLGGFSTYPLTGLAGLAGLVGLAAGLVGAAVFGVGALGVLGAPGALGFEVCLGATGEVPAVAGLVAAGCP